MKTKHLEIAHINIFHPTWTYICILRCSSSCWLLFNWINNWIWSSWISKRIIHRGIKGILSPNRFHHWIIKSMKFTRWELQDIHLSCVNESRYIQALSFSSISRPSSHLGWFIPCSKRKDILPGISRRGSLKARGSELKKHLPNKYH